MPKQPQEIQVIWNRPPKLKGERPPMDLERLAELWYGTQELNQVDG